MNYINSNNFKYLLNNSHILKFNDTFYNLASNTSVIQCRRTISPAYSNYFDITMLKRLKINTIDIPANTSTSIGVMNFNADWCNIWTVLGSLAFSTSDYSSITSTDSITISIQTITGDSSKMSTFTYKLYPQYVNYCQFVDHELTDAFIRYIYIFVTSTVPVTLMQPTLRDTKVSSIYIDFINM